MGRERDEDRGGDGGDLHPSRERRRAHADIHSDGDGIFRRDGVSDQRSDGRDCGGEFDFRIQSRSNGVAFTALHTYFMSPSGSDSNNGLTAATAWATPNHAVNCGDVIIAAAGSYPDLQSWGTVGNCPSTSGGIDGNGGVYFATLLCGGSYVGACDITTKTNTTGNTVASMSLQAIGRSRDGTLTQVTTVERSKPMRAPIRGG